MAADGQGSTARLNDIPNNAPDISNDGDQQSEPPKTSCYCRKLQVRGMGPFDPNHDHEDLPGPSA